MVAPTSLFKVAGHWLYSFCRAARKFRSYGFLHRVPSRPHLLSSSVSKCPLEGREGQTLLVSDLHGSLLRPSTSLFPYFMLVAFEGGGLLRSLLLLLSSPLLWLLGHQAELSLRIMVFITFCGLRRKDMELVARAVLPKFYLENLHLHGYELLTSTTGKKVVLTRLPRLMVEGFLEDYLGVTEVVGTELHVAHGNYFTGLVSSGSMLTVKQKAITDLFGEAKADVGLVSSSDPLDHLLVSAHSKEVYTVNKSSTPSTPPTLPREKYPKPLIFHDGRLAFLPTTSAAFALFLWLPFAIPLAVIRIILGTVPPYKAVIPLIAAAGSELRVDGPIPDAAPGGGGGGKGVLYVCTHRTLLDPVVLATALRRPVPAVTYSLSSLSELIAPVRTVRLTRDRARDGETMRRLLAEGDLAVCPEGTTCREPYLLRFSPLFAELGGEIAPVAMDVASRTFYGTTASGLKWLDPFMLFMNPRPGYRVEFLERLPRELTVAGGGRSPAEVANLVQRRLAAALGFECTKLTRRDKYMMLARNDGVVKKKD